MDPATSDPNIALAVIMNDQTVPADVRVVAAKTLQPYFHGPPLTEEQMMRLEQQQLGLDPGDDPVLAEKRKRAYDLVSGLIEQNAKLLAQVNGQPPAHHDPKSEPEATDLEVEEVIPGDEYKPGRAPLDNTTIDAQAAKKDLS